MVVVKDWGGPALTWSEEDFAKLLGGLTPKATSLDVMYEWQSASKRMNARKDPEAPITEKGTLRKFKHLAESSEMPVNLLDFPISEEITPSIILHIACDVQALTATTTMMPMKSIQADVQKYRLWALLTAPGYYAYPHVDGSGLCTYMMITQGCKYWAILRMADPKKKLTKKQLENYATCTRKAFNQYLKIAKVSNVYNVAPTELPGLVTVHFIKLEPGMLAIQPPGVFHQVYTPEKSVAVGGHFVVEEALHLTAWSRFCTTHAQGAGTNAYHDSTIRVFACIMVAAAVRRELTMNKRCFISLARMLKQRKLFSLADFVKENTDDPDPVHPETEDEVDLALELVDEVLSHNGLMWERLEITSKGPPLFDDELPWYDPGVEMVDHPSNLLTIVQQTLQFK
ncbi:uncharacterized protein PHACADRAFT_108377 [Phanerochaete carnosa HHB-10118-sp]|uniref:JmjC domain-containing protein n=1 Tax=Phanerochaete carnosa (strain HHB-10118-sp) TaxID=650164 RepID=K5WEY6_PHACS|nr:uncharacterized protein PHACADRAFT_108377 [Phanerochaete carnosa HHB-10118-sp]EKM48737.1 hypothetical protein PHACADRAFT_108377 [Phanerochaete carnosa HHB-10118-sp]